MKKKTIGFIGAGNMAGAIIHGLRQSAAASRFRVVAYDVDPDRLAELSRDGAAEPARSNADVVRKSDVIILAVKPAQVNVVLKEVARLVGEKKLLVSIAAGVTLFQIESRLKVKVPLIRVMPNTPLLVGKGMSAFSCGTVVREEDRRLVRDLFAAAGRVIEVEEKYMDAVTALSGSGPAYVFGFIEGLADGGVLAGLPRREAVLLAAQTVAGAAEMVLSTGRHPAELKDMVASPGGTTIHVYQVLEDGGLKGLVMEAVEAAWRRSRQLAEG